MLKRTPISKTKHYNLSLTPFQTIETLQNMFGICFFSIHHYRTNITVTFVTNHLTYTQKHKNWQISPTALYQKVSIIRRTDRNRRVKTLRPKPFLLQRVMAFVKKVLFGGIQYKFTNVWRLYSIAKSTH